MSELGGGVHEHPDPWTDAGYQAHDVEADGVPVCPICDAADGHLVNTGPLGGLICGTCLACFTSAPGERVANLHRRELWAEETRGDT